MGDSVGRIVGSIVGFAVGGPQGAAYGYQIGALVDGPASGPDQQGPRLGDLQVQSSAYGAPIPIVYGTARIAGNVIWSLPIKETSHEEESGGKGGGGGSEVTTYTYSATFALGLCDGEIVGVRRIWADGNLIYDVSASSDTQSLIASNQAADGLAFYTGSETQEADPLIQADKGVANTPAFRGHAYIVFDDLQLEKYGNRIPNITCEVISEGSLAGFRRIASITDTGVQFAKNGTNGVGRPMIYSADDILRVKIINSATDHIFDLNGNLISSEPVGDSGVVPDFVANFRYPVGTFEYGKIHAMNLDSPVGSGLILPVDFIHEEGEAADVGTATADLSSALPSGEYVGGCAISTDKKRLMIFTSPSDATPGGNVVNKWYQIELNLEAVLDVPTIVDSGTLAVTTSVHSLMLGNASAFHFGCNSLENDYQHFWTAYGAGSGDVVLYEIINGVLTETNRLSVTAEGLPLFDFTYPTCWAEDGMFLTFSSTSYATFTRTDHVSPGTVTLQSITSDILGRSGLTASHYNTAALSTLVDGYVVARPMTARAAIEPLQQAFLFDAHETGNKLTFVYRGGASVTSIPEVDLGASYDGGSASLIEQSRQQDAELPSKVIVNYIDIDTDYQSGSQKAQIINANVENVVIVELAIAMTASKAKQLAEVLLANTWVERERFSLRLNSDYIQLNPTDVITATANGVARVMRVTRAMYGGVIELECASEDAAVYASSAQAGSGGFVSQSVELIGPTRLFVLDIPMLTNVDNDAGLYVAGAGYFDTRFSASVFKSLDGGSSYSSVASLFNAATIGSTDDALVDGSTTLWDRASTVTVRLTGSGALSSDTEDNVLRGSHHCVIGNEIVQFVNATLNADGSYTLDTFLRGRRGTEWATSTHAIGDRFVLLSELAVSRVSAQLNLERLYKGVTSGGYLDDATSQAVTNTGVSLKPFSPAYVDGSRDGSDNLTITWMRRSRAVSAPLWRQPVFEESESYEVDIMDGATVARTLSGLTSETASYTAAQQTTDFGSVQSSVTVRIYQLSATVGRGYKAEETI